MSSPTPLSPPFSYNIISQNENKGYFTPEPSSTQRFTPSTPAWLKKGMVRMKSLDYRFSDENTAIFSKKPSIVAAVANRNQQKLDSHAYRMKVLAEKGKGGLRSSGTALDIDLEGEWKKQQLQYVTKSPGYGREKSM